jgi:hypothetical protein
LAIWLLKTSIFYLVIKVFSILSLDRPFDLKVARLVSKIGYFAFSMGIVALLKGIARTSKKEMQYFNSIGAPQNTCL